MKVKGVLFDVIALDVENSIIIACVVRRCGSDKTIGHQHCQAAKGRSSPILRDHPHLGLLVTGRDVSSAAFRAHGLSSCSGLEYHNSACILIPSNSTRLIWDLGNWSADC